MKESKVKIGILFNFDPVWMGGIIYIMNLIRMFEFLDENEKPEITIFYRADLSEYIRELSYSNLKTIQWKFPKVIKGYLYSILIRRNLFIDKIVRSYDLDVLYPLQDYPVKTRSNTKLISWFADLQHMHYPEFFSRRKIIERNLRLRLILKNSNQLFVSSEAVKEDFYKFFNVPSSIKIHVFHFASIICKIDHLVSRDLYAKYELPEKYFLISNQFHKHKNHKVLLKALAHIEITQREKIHLAITGRFPSAEHSDYMREIHNILEFNDLRDNVKVLGIIPRNEQLWLMKNAMAVIQPSLFEGWSTVIEDAISLNVPVIASSIPVNIEQLGEKGFYFDPFDHIELAKLLLEFRNKDLGIPNYQKYEERVKSAAMSFLQFCGN